MPDTRKHRGPHPSDNELFSEAQLGGLRQAVGDLAWLLTRGYAAASSLKLVGDRYQLAARQRLAVMRSCCSDQQRDHRSTTELGPQQLAGQELWIDGFNLLTTIESALAGGVLIVGRDTCCRDMASMHGNYRRVEETRPALQLVGRFLEQLDVAACHWVLDRPVSNSGRLSQLLLELAAENRWRWETQLAADADQVLSDKPIVVTADSAILDVCRSWFNLAARIVHTVPNPHIVDLEVKSEK